MTLNLINLLKESYARMIKSKLCFLKNKFNIIKKKLINTIKLRKIKWFQSLKKNFLRINNFINKNLKKLLNK